MYPPSLEIGGVRRRQGKPHLHTLILISLCLSRALCFPPQWSLYLYSGVWFQGNEKPVLLALPLDLSLLHIETVQVKSLGVCFVGPLAGVQTVSS